MPSNKNKFSKLEIVLIFLIILIAGKMINNGIPTPVTQNIPGVNSKKIELPASGETKYYIDNEPIAPFSIESEKNQNYFIKLVDKSTNNTAVTIFVQGGNKVEVKIPLGIYEFRYASGNKWYGEETLFGHNTSYFKADEEFKFYMDGQQIMGNHIKLIRRMDGNLRTYNIGKQQF